MPSTSCCAPASTGPSSACWREVAVEDKLNHRFRRVAELADDPSVPRTAFVSTAALGDAKGALIGGLTYIGATAAIGAVVISGGALGAALGAAVVAGGAGTLLGSILAKLVGQHHANYLHDQIERGGLLLWVRAWEAGEADLAMTILRKHGADHVHSHDCLVAC